MKVAKTELVEGENAGAGDALLLGASSWSDDDTSFKYGWLDKNGKRTRGGKLPTCAVPQGVLFAARKGYLDRAQMARIARGLVDYSRNRWCKPRGWRELRRADAGTAETQGHDGA
jgi:hypothetical protein